MNSRFWRGKNVLITGNTGFKGSWLSYWLSTAGAKVTGLSLPPESSPSLYESARLGETIETHVVDVRDGDRVRDTIEAGSFEIVFHLAAQPLVRASYEKPLETYATNVMGTANLLQAARHNDAVRVIVCVTTDKCYENQEWIWPYRENDCLGGRDPYSSSKACAEIVASAYSRSFFSAGDAPAVATARAGNVIGGGDWSEDRIVPDLMRAFHLGEPAVVRNPSAIRPWQSVLDALNGYLMLAEHMYREPRAFSEAWNFGPQAGSERTVRAVAEHLRLAWGDGASWKHRPSEDAPHEAATLRLDSSKARARLGWRELIPVDEVLSRIACWYREFYGGGGARSLMDGDLRDFERRMESGS